MSHDLSTVNPMSIQDPIKKDKTNNEFVPRDFVKNQFNNLSTVNPMSIRDPMKRNETNNKILQRDF